MEESVNAEFIYRPPSDYRFSFLQDIQNYSLGVKFANAKKILNDSWVVNMVDKKLLETPMPTLKYIRKPKEKPMFNEIALEFIKETAEKDLKAVEVRISSIVDQMAYYGKQLSDVKAAKAKLMSILESYKEKESYDKPKQSRCC